MLPPGLPNFGLALPIKYQAPRLNLHLLVLVEEQLKQLLIGLLEDGLLVTLAANVLTLPLIVYYFGRLSPFSLLANFLILPVQPLIMLGGSAAVVAGVTRLVWVESTPALGDLAGASLDRAPGARNWEFAGR